VEVFLEVIVPGPWWHPLTYEWDRPAERGVRLSVPVAGRTRTGFATGTVSGTPPAASFRILKAKEILDDSPPLGWELFETALRLGRHFLCGPGEALKVVSPDHILAGEPTGDLPRPAPPGESFSESQCFLPSFGDRKEEYLRSILSSKAGVLVLFPEREGASSFWKGLPPEVKREGVLWTSSSGVAARKRWERVRTGEARIVVGSPAAAFAPLPSMDLVIVEDEGNPAYNSERFPYFNSRSVAGSRARLWGAGLIYGGSVPSARSFLKGASWPGSNGPGKYVFVSLRDARRITVPGVNEPLTVSDTALSRTRETVQEKGTVIWVLDRKGYSSTVICGECGRLLTCERCGLPIRWDDGRQVFTCTCCGKENPVSDLCPSCGGRSLQGSRPGLEGARMVAESVLGEDLPLFTWHADVRQTVSSRKKMIEGLAGGGVVVGSRKSLEICDFLSVPLICWLDADSAAGAPFFDSRVRAFRMIWESAWRGPGHDGRTVVVQSRRPRTGWQKGLVAGWDYFWKNELEERRVLDLPPWRYLVEIANLGESKERIKGLLIEKGIEPLDPGSSMDMIWVKCSDLEGLRKTLAPLFIISGSSRVFPRISLRSD